MESFLCNKLDEFSGSFRRLARSIDTMQERLRRIRDHVEKLDELLADVKAVRQILESQKATTGDATHDT